MHFLILRQLITYTLRINIQSTKFNVWSITTLASITCIKSFLLIIYVAIEIVWVRGLGMRSTSTLLFLYFRKCRTWNNVSSSTYQSAIAITLKFKTCEWITISFRITSRKCWQNDLNLPIEGVKTDHLHSSIVVTLTSGSCHQQSRIHSTVDPILKISGPPVRSID